MAVSRVSIAPAAAAVLERLRARHGALQYEHWKHTHLSILGTEERGPAAG